MKTMHLMSFTIVVGCMLAGIARFRWKRLLATLAVSIILVGVAAFGIRTYLKSSFQDRYSREDLITVKQPLFPELRPNTQVRLLKADSNESNELDQSRVERIRDRGVLRVGYDPNKRPFCFHSSTDRLQQ